MKTWTIIEATGTSISAKNGVKDKHTILLMLRYTLAHAKVLNANQKFLQAEMKYHDLSMAHLYTDVIDVDDLLSILGRAVKCAIFSPNSAQRQRCALFFTLDFSLLVFLLSEYLMDIYHSSTFTEYLTW